jgi:hypothetical protein
MVHYFNQKRIKNQAIYIHRISYMLYQLYTASVFFNTVSFIHQIKYTPYQLDTVSVVYCISYTRSGLITRSSNAKQSMHCYHFYKLHVFKTLNCITTIVNPCASVVNCTSPYKCHIRYTSYQLDTVSLRCGIS